MSTITWIVIGIALAIVAELFGRKSMRKDPGWKEMAHNVGGVQYPVEERRTGHRIEHPHVIEADDYECSECGGRFSSDETVCPYCGAELTESFVNEDEFMEEEEEMEAWDEEDDE